MRWLSRLFGSVPPALVLPPEQRAALADWQRLPAVDLDAAHQRCRYVVVDVETSGLNMKIDRLISIGAVALVNGRIDFADAFAVILRQDQVSSDANILIHGIGGSAQSEGIDPATALLAFLGYIGKAPLVAYHAFFDRAMIEKAMHQHLGAELGQRAHNLAAAQATGAHVLTLGGLAHHHANTLHVGCPLTPALTLGVAHLVAAHRGLGAYITKHSHGFTPPCRGIAVLRSGRCLLTAQVVYHLCQMNASLWHNFCV